MKDEIYQRNGESLFDFYCRREDELKRQSQKIADLIVAWANIFVSSDEEENVKMAPGVLSILCKKHKIIEKQLDEVTEALDNMR